MYGGTALGFAIPAFAALNLAFTGAWISLAAVLARNYKNESHGPGQNRSTGAALLVSAPNSADGTANDPRPVRLRLAVRAFGPWHRLGV